MSSGIELLLLHWKQLFSRLHTQAAVSWYSTSHFLRHSHFHCQSEVTSHSVCMQYPHSACRLVSQSASPQMPMMATKHHCPSVTVMPPVTPPSPRQRPTPTPTSPWADPCHSAPPFAAQQPAQTTCSAPPWLCTSPMASPVAPTMLWVTSLKCPQMCSPPPVGLQSWTPLPGSSSLTCSPPTAALQRLAMARGELVSGLSGACWGGACKLALAISGRA